MKYFFIATLTSLLSLSLSAQDIPAYNLEELQARIYQDNDVTYIVNFWATWCAPCIKEMPYFEALEAKYKDNDKVKVILVSLDFTYDRLVKFVEKKKMKAEVIHYTEKRPNEWIPAFSDEWTGSIPATLVLNGNLKINDFYEQSFESVKDLENLLP